MKFHHILATGMLTLSLATGGAFAATKAEKQAEVQKSPRQRWPSSTRPSRS